MRKCVYVSLLAIGLVVLAPALVDASAKSAADAGVVNHKVDTGFPISHRAAINEGFEGGAVPPAGWTHVQTNPSETWFADTLSVHSGTYAATCNYDAALGAQEEVLYSPAISGTTGFMVQFYSMGSIYWCRDTYDNCDLNIYLDTDTTWNNGNETLVHTADGDWPDNWVWQLSQVDLSAYADGTSYHVAFAYEGADGAQISLDDIELLTDEDLPVVGCGGDVTVLEEHFEAWPPTGWQIINNGGDCVWDSSANIGGTNLTGGTGASAMADSDYCGSGTTMNTELWTPAMDLTGYSSAWLRAKAYLNVFTGGGETFTIDVSSDGGSSWMNLATWTDDQTGQDVEFDLTSYASDNVVVRFTYDAQGWYWDAQVDEVYVCGEAAIQPPPDAIPTMNSAGIIVMLVLLTGVAVMLLRRH